MFGVGAGGRRPLAPGGEVQARSAALGIPEADPLTRAMEALRSFRVAVAEARTMPDTTL